MFYMSMFVLLLMAISFAIGVALAGLIRDLLDRRRDG